MNFYIDCSNVTEPVQLHRRLAQTLAFPDWYGHNLDALYDCLTELPFSAVIYLSGWDSSSQWASGFETAMAEAQISNPSLTVIFDNFQQRS